MQNTTTKTTIDNATISFSLDDITSKDKLFLKYVFIVSNYVYEGFINITEDDNNYQYLQKILNFVKDKKSQNLRLGVVTIYKDCFVVESSMASCGFNCNIKCNFNFDIIRKNLLDLLLDRDILTLTYNQKSNITPISKPITFTSPIQLNEKEILPNNNKLPEVNYDLNKENVHKRQRIPILSKQFELNPFDNNIFSNFTYNEPSKPTQPFQYTQQIKKEEKNNNCFNEVCNKNNSNENKTNYDFFNMLFNQFKTEKPENTNKKTEIKDLPKEQQQIKETTEEKFNINLDEILNQILNSNTNQSNGLNFLKNFNFE